MIFNPYNLELYPISTEINVFEFGSVDSYAFAYSNVSVYDVDITTSRRSWNNINFPCTDNYSINNRNIEFKFSSEYQYNFDIFQCSAGSTCAANLTDERNQLNINIDICNGSVGSSIQYQIINNKLNPVNNTIIEFTERYIDGTLLYVFDDMLPCTGDYKLNRIHSGATVTVSLDFDDIEVITGVESDTNFNLLECDSSVNFDLGECGVGFIYGKNLNYDIKLCPGDSNPDLNRDRHNFIIEPDFLTKDCEVLELDFYHGATGNVGFTSSVIFSNVNGYHGGEGEFDIVISQNFDADVYSGEYFSTVLTNNPAEEFDVEVYYGASSQFELSTVLIFQNIAIYSGEYGNLELTDSPGEEIPMDAHHGVDGEFELNTLPVIQLENSYVGAYSDLEFTSYPAHELVGVIYTGNNLDCTIMITQNFSVDGYHGIYANIDIETAPSEGISVIESYHGIDSIFELATVATLRPVSTHGIYSDLDFSTTTTIGMVGYGGEYSETEFTLNPPDEFDPIVSHGVSSEFDMSLTKALFPRGYSGSYIDIELDDHPAIELIPTSYHGINVNVDITETEFNLFGYHGTTLNEFELQVEVSLPLDAIYHGSYGSVDDIKRDVGLNADVYHGARGTISNFNVPEGESIIAEAFGGAVLTPSVRAVVSAILTPHPIGAAHALRDGLGGVGGINHCPISSDDLDPTYGDNVIRLGFDPLGIEDQLNFSFDDIGDDPWTTCNSGGITFDVGVQTQPRFEFDIYAGESVTTFFPMKLFALIGEDVPISRLYDYEYTAIITQPVFDLEPIEVQVLVEVWDHPDDFVAFVDQHLEVDLTLTAFGQFDHGVEVEFELATTEYAWKRAMGAFTTGEVVQIEFEPIEYTRFCKGYIVPNGNSVVFEFGVDSENYGCSIWIGNAGEYASFELAGYYQPGLTMYSGEYARSSLEVQTRWTLISRGGATCFANIYDEPEFDTFAYHGSYAQCTFEELPIIGAHGAVANIDDLIIPGPGIQWQTETQCLPNDFLPTTPDGDIDYDKLEPDINGVVQYPKVPVEYKEYRYILDARCITFDQSQSETE